MALFRIGVKNAVKIYQNKIPLMCARSIEDKIDPIDHATGLEKKELLAHLAGNENPFDMRVYKRGPGTKDNPNLIPSVFDKRMIGCICDEESTTINWLWLHMGEPRRCECGYWFALKQSKPL